MHFEPSEELKIAVPFEKLPRDQVKVLNSERAQYFLSEVLRGGSRYHDLKTLRYLVHVLKVSRKHRVTSRSMVYCTFSPGDEGLNDYFSTRRQFESLTSIGIDESINSLFVAFWLQRQKKDDLNQYIKGGLLSQAAGDVILDMAVADKAENKNGSLLRKERRPDTGKLMVSEQLKEASLRAFGREPTKSVELSSEQFEAHQARMAEYHASKGRRIANNKTLLETIEAFEAGIPSR